MPDFNPHVKEPTDREYELTCRIVRKKMQYDDDQSRGSLGNTEVDVVLLVPEQSSECDRFFGAWLPEPAVITLEGKVFQDNFYECLGILGGPVHSPVRMALHRASKLHPEPYFFVMSAGVEQELLKIPQRFFKKPKISLKVLGESSETIADSTHDPDLPFQAKYKNVK